MEMYCNRGIKIAMRLSLSIISIIFLQCLSALADDDPFGPAKAGKLECFAPDTENKTCFAITRYTWQSDGTVSIEDEVEVSAHPLVTMKVKSIGTIEGSTACAKRADESLNNASFFKDGKLVSEDESASYRQTMKSRRGGLSGKNICMDISPMGSLFITEFSIDDTPLPAATNRLKWVGADEGYVLAP